MKPDLVVLGHILNETIRFADGRTLGPVLGGPVSYFAVAAARLGAAVGIVAKIGEDMPKHLLQPIYQAAIDTRGLIVEPSGMNNVLIYHADGRKTLEFVTKASPLSLQDVPEEYREADIIYAGAVMWDPPLAVLRALYRPRTKLAVELGGYGGAHHDVKHYGRGYEGFLQELLPYAHIAKASREDCTTLFAGGNLAPEKYARLLVEWGAQLGIITLGEQGAVVATADDVFKIPPLSDRAIDTTGAGDVYSAGFLVHYHKYGDAKEAGLFASATAALVCERTGGVVLERMPSFSEVMERLSQYENAAETLYG